MEADMNWAYEARDSNVATLSPD